MKKTIVILGAAVTLAGVLWLTDHLLSRSDRIAATARKDAMITVRDQVLRYQSEHGVLPRDLSDLVPAYLRADQVVRDNAPIYLYNSAARTLAQLHPNAIRGLVRREWPAAIMPLSAFEQIAGGDNGTIRPEILAGGAAIVPKEPDLKPPPEGTLVFEAEHWSEMNWGWEIHADPKAGGGAWIQSWEGKTNGPAQLSCEVFNFYDVRPKRETTSLKYRFHLDKPGRYYFYARMWTTDTHCSNSVSATVDEVLHEEGHTLGNTDPFQWLWSVVDGSPFSLSAGDHYLNIFIHEDGLMIDQFMISPKRLFGWGGAQPGPAYKENFKTGEGTAWQKKAPPVHLSFDLADEVLRPGHSPDINVTMRRLKASDAKGSLKVWLEGAGLGGKNWKVLERPVNLATLSDLAWVPLSFDGLNIAGLDRREYMLHAELSVEDKVVAETHDTLVRPFLWQVIGPIDYLENGRKGPFDGAKNPDPRDSRQWEPFKESSFMHFGVLDFGMQTEGNSANAPTNVTIYARTRIRVPETADYVFLMQSDDQMMFWIDGKLRYEYDDIDKPVTRSAERRTLRLQAGEHELRMRVNQYERFWQASVRIRKADDSLSEVVGIEPVK